LSAGHFGFALRFADFLRFASLRFGLVSLRFASARFVFALVWFQFGLGSLRFASARLVFALVSFGFGLFFLQGVGLDFLFFFRV